MKPFYLPVVLSVLFLCSSCGSENEIEDEADPETDNLIFPDAAFKNALVNTNSVDTNNDGQGDVDMDINNDGEIQRPEAEAAKGLILRFDYSSLGRYVDLSGIENIINLTSLSITGEGVLFEGNKTSIRQGRNIYGMQMARSSYEGAKTCMKNHRPFNLTRSGFSGIQRYSAVWTGDNVAYDEHMLLGVRLVSSMGLSGIAFAGTET